MQTLTLAHRDNDRTPVILAIREIARRHYDLDVHAVQIKATRPPLGEGTRSRRIYREPHQFSGMK